jgi:hypothetical protein
LAEHTQELYDHIALHQVVVVLLQLLLLQEANEENAQVLIEV